MITNLVVSVLIGLALVVAVFLGLRRWLGYEGPRAAALAALAVVSPYMVYALVVWPGADVFAIHLALYLVTAYILGIMAGERDALAEGPAGEAAAGGFHWGPAIIITFFICLFIVLATFVTIAQRGLEPQVARWLLPEPRHTDSVRSVFPGTVARDFHKKEELYNRYLEQVRLQQERGWQVNFGWIEPHQPHVGSPALFQLKVLDRHGEPVTGAEVAGEFLRPSDSGRDQTFSLRESRPGVYTTTVTFPEPGSWNMLLLIQRGEDLHEVQATTQIARGG